MHARPPLNASHSHFTSLGLCVRAILQTIVLFPWERKRRKNELLLTKALTMMQCWGLLVKCEMNEVKNGKKYMHTHAEATAIAYSKIFIGKLQKSILFILGKC